MILRWKIINSVTAACVGIIAIITGAPKAIESLDENGFPVHATRGFVRSQIANDRQANIVIRDALIELTIVRRRWLVHERETTRTRLSIAVDPDTRRLLEDGLDRYDADLAAVDDALTALRRLRQ